MFLCVFFFFFLLQQAAVHCRCQQLQGVTPSGSEQNASGEEGPLGSKPSDSESGSERNGSGEKDVLSGSQGVTPQVVNQSEPPTLTSTASQGVTPFGE